MDSSAPDCFSIFEIYKRYSDIKANNLLHRNDDTDVVKLSREALTELYRLIDKSMLTRGSLFDEVTTLMSRLNLKEDFSEFSNFYEFVYFLCRENGQKNISVNRAIAAWKLVLSGRFRLLNQWCDFIEENDAYVLDITFRKSSDAWREVTEIQSFITIMRCEPRQKNQRHNISLDTWSQVLAFSRCVHEDLEGYDPEGAWPVLIDDFVEHMYRITGSSCCVSRDMACSCADSESQQFAPDDTLPGLKGFPGLKRKLRDDNQRKDLDISGALSLESLSIELDSKRRKQGYDLVSCKENQLMNPSIETLQLNNPIMCSMSLCSVEQCLSKGFEGLLSSHSSVQFNPEDEALYS